MKLRDHLTEISDRLANIEAELKYHIRRTDLLEKDLAPVKRHVEFINSLAKLTIAVIASAGVLVGIFKAFF